LKRFFFRNLLGFFKDQIVSAGWAARWPKHATPALIISVFIRLGKPYLIRQTFIAKR